MPKVKKNLNRKKQDVPEKMICQNQDCAKYGKEQPIRNFYNINSNILKKYPICKDCIQKIINVNDMTTVYKILRDMDVAFIKSVWDSNYEKNPDSAFGNYVRLMNTLSHLKGLRWKDSVTKDRDEDEEYFIENFKPTKEMVERWGSKHEREDYIKLENFYNDMKISNSIETAQDMVYLKKIAIISLKLDNALEEGNYGEAKQLGDLFSKYMADSKFRAMDKTDSDRTGGIRNFGAIYSEVEKDGFIPPWEQYRKIKGITQDIVDKTIMHIENFTLKLNRVEKMTRPPEDTPKLEECEIDYDESTVLNDIEVDMNDDVGGDDL